MPNAWDVEGAWTPQNWDELKGYAGASGWSEDYDRWNNDQRTFTDWMNWWDPNARKFRSAKTDAQGNALQGFVEKPDETPEGWTAWGQHAIPTAEAQQRMAAWNGGGGSQSASGASSLTLPPSGAAPSYSFTPFQAPNLTDDPGYQFRLKEGLGAIERSAAARGTLGTGGTLKDLMDYGQGLASQEYGNAFNRAMGGWQGNLGAGQFEWGTRYQPWSQQFQAGENRWQTGQQNDLSRWTTQFGGQLSRDLNRENNIFNLLGGPAPQMPGYQSF